jgi:hypothetical protein
MLDFDVTTPHPPEGIPYIDPTENVKLLVEAANKRQDDLREITARHLSDQAELRAGYEDKLRRAESERIDAIRAVDVSAVNRAAEVQATQANTLAGQVATTADAFRASLAAALAPIQASIEDLRRAQYEAQGQKTQVVETRDVRAESRLNINTVVVVLGVLISALLLYAAFHGH